MSSFVAALRLLTTVPVGWSIGADARSIARSPVFFPIIGLGIGLILAGADYGLSIFLSGGVAAALIVGGGIAFTGGLHLDGLADTADALGGGRTAKRRLQIMRDPSIGTFGATAVGLSLLLRWACIAALLGTPRFAVIAIAPLLGRWAALVLVDVFRYVRPSGLGSPYVDGEGSGESALPNSPSDEIGGDSGGFGGRQRRPEDQPRETRGQKSPQPPLYEREDAEMRAERELADEETSDVHKTGGEETGTLGKKGDKAERSVPTFRVRTAAGAAFTLAITFALLGPWGLLAFGIGTASAVFLGKYAASRLGGGVTGDVYGAANEVAEIAALIALVGLSRGDLLTIPVWI